MYVLCMKRTFEVRVIFSVHRAAAADCAKAPDSPSVILQSDRPERTAQKRRTKTVAPIATRFHVKDPRHLLWEPPKGSYGYCVILGSIVGLLFPLIVIAEPL